MTEPELLIYLYDLVDWSNPRFRRQRSMRRTPSSATRRSGPSTARSSVPPGEEVSGLVRRPGWSQAEIADRQRAAVLAEIDARGTERPNPAEVVDQDGPQAESEPAYQAPVTPAAPAAPAAPVAVNPTIRSPGPRCRVWALKAVRPGGRGALPSPLLQLPRRHLSRPTNLTSRTRSPGPRCRAWALKAVRHDLT